MQPLSGTRRSKPRAPICLRLAVANTAPPISPEVIDLMRNPFRTGAVGPVNSRNPGRLGIGLYIASAVT